MKKVISGGIILFVAIYVLTVGFLIVQASLTGPFSNAQLIANFFVPQGPFSAIGVAHLADATSAIIQRNFKEAVSINSFSEISAMDLPPPPPPAPPADSTSTATSTTPEHPDATSTEQALQVLAATLTHLQMTSSTETP